VKASGSGAPGNKNHSINKQRKPVIFAKANPFCARQQGVLRHTKAGYK
jgi:hypothetical protein